MSKMKITRVALLFVWIVLGSAALFVGDTFLCMVSMLNFCVVAFLTSPWRTK